MIAEALTELNLTDYTGDGRARAAAIRVLSTGQVRPTGLIEFHSGGNLLVIGDGASALEAALSLRDRLQVTFLTTAPDPSGVRFEQADGIVRMAGKPAKLTGHLGRFRVTFETVDGNLEVKQATEGLREEFDLVLDLGEPPLIRSDVSPPGYFAPQLGRTSLEEAVAELPALVGEFEKPQYYQYDPDICAHSRSGIQACTRCLDACPTDAIRSVQDLIEVDSNLCQGAGVCASACPTGAIRYAYPALDDTLSRVGGILKSFRQAGGSRATLLFYGSEDGAQVMKRIAGRLAENVIPFPVEEVGSVGMDVWLSALAHGAAEVRLLADSATPASVTEEIEAQLTYTRALLQGMGYPANSLSLNRFCTDEQLLSELGQESTDFLISPAGFAGVDEKRTMLRLAIDHLYEHAPAQRPLIGLPTGAPFGEVTVDEGRCTLCMACVSQCPGKALEAGGDVPQLKFREENCVQCAMCARTCPEDAIAPSPRYLFDKDKRRSWRVLKEEEVFNCISCGKPFSTRSMIERMTSKLQGHRMFQGAGMKRLQMCEDCRVRDMYAGELPALDDQTGEGEQR